MARRSFRRKYTRVAAATGGNGDEMNRRERANVAIVVRENHASEPYDVMCVVIVVLFSHTQDRSKIPSSTCFKRGSQPGNGA